MGNQICCEEAKQIEQQHHITVVHKKQELKPPQLSESIIEILQKQSPFQKELAANPTIKEYDNDIYEGKIDERGRPHGFGKMYHKNGSLFIGKFQEGIANGSGFYIKSDGSYYEGSLINNRAQDQNGHYWSKTYEYRGGIMDNTPHGEGKESGPNHEFTGSYIDGKKVKGTMKWTEGNDEFTYTGEFDEDGLFHGQGELVQPKGRYVGQFNKGRKSGKGEFLFKNGLKYVGEYKNNHKQGFGKAVNKNGTIAYDGTFVNNIPHGKGKVQSKDGKINEREWIEGIDKSYLEN